MGLVIICDADQSFTARLEKVVASNAGVETVLATNPTQAVELGVAKDAYAIAFGPSADRADVFRASELLALSAPRLVTLLIARDVDAELLRTAMRAGFRDVIDLEGLTYGELGEAVGEAYRAAVQLRGSQPEAAAARAHVISIFGTKGGVGKSVIASNMAVALASKFEKRVVLLDLDLESGDDALMLGLEPTRTIHDAVQAFDRLDAQMLEGFLREHKSGARVLLAPTQPEQSEPITAARVGKIIDLAKELADIVVIDTAGRLDETVLAAIDKSDRVLAVATMDLPSIKNTKMSLHKLRQLGYQNGMVSLVLNRSDSKVFLEPGDVEQAVGSKVLAHIPSDRLVPRSVNRGVPVVLDQPKSAVAKSMVDLARLVI